MDEIPEKSQTLIFLEKIKEEEEKARKLIDEARKAKASKIIQDAYEEAQKIKEDSLAKARREAEENEKAIIKKASVEAERIRDKAEGEAERLRKRVKSLLPKAVDKVRERIRQYLEGRSI